MRDTADLPEGVLPEEGFTLRILNPALSKTTLLELAPDSVAVAVFRA